jgi:FkbM family methyltransferase
MFKKLVKKTINKLGFDLKRYNLHNKKNELDDKKNEFDDLLKDKISNNPIIFDVGGNKGQSIEKYLKIFDKPIIHSFEPVKTEFDYMSNKFKNKKNIFLNNFALGNKTEEKEFNITAKTGNSSFNKINLGTDWLKRRSRQYNTSEEGYVTSVQKVNVIKLDDYCKDKNISVIDLLKIDTQGYEDKVLEGSLNLIIQNKIKVIVTEIMFDNVYDKYFSFSDIEKFIIPYNFRMVGIKLSNNSLFSSYIFVADVYYFNKNFYKL